MIKRSLYSLLGLRTQGVCRNASKNFFCTAPPIPQPAPLPSHSTSNVLYKRLAPLGDVNVSMVPVLDQWVQEGRNVDQRQLRGIVKEMQKYRRYTHALQISQWMTDRRYFPPSELDVVVRLTLIYKVHSIERAEEYFNNTPQVFKRSGLYTALLNCYVKNKSVEKAESVMQKLQEMGYANTKFAYNILLGLYYHLGDLEKLENLLHEMEQKGIKGDIYTYTTCLSAYADASDRNKMDMIMTRIESSSRIFMDQKSYSVAAIAYHKVGSGDKVLEMLEKIEGLMKTLCPSDRDSAFDFLLRMNAKIGRRDELYRIWNSCKKKRIFNRGYRCMISSVLMFDDIEGAKKIFDEWESRGLTYDFRIPNCLIDAYAKDGNLKEAKALLSHGIAKGGNPTSQTWISLAGGYIGDDQVEEAIKALNNAIPLCPPHPDLIKDRLSTCLEYLEGRGNMNDVEKFMHLLKDEEVFLPNVLEKFRSFIMVTK